MQDTHFLRPALTKHIIQRLQRGESLNLFGKPGIGKTRILDDIHDSAEPDKTFVIIVPFHGYQHSYQGFCEAIWKSVNQKTTAPTNLNEIIEALKQSKKQIFLFIDDFDYFFENPKLDPKYDLRFIDALNAIRNTSGVSLLAVTEVPVSNRIIIMNQESFTSTLNLTPVEISKIPFLEIQAELNRIFNGVLKDEQIVFLTSHLNEHENAYGILKYYEPKILGNEDIQLKFEDRLKKWLKMFEQGKHELLMKKAVKSLDKLEGWALYFSRLRKLIPFESLWNGLKKVGGLLMIWKKGN